VEFQFSMGPWQVFWGSAPARFAPMADPSFDLQRVLRALRRIGWGPGSGTSWRWGCGGRGVAGSATITDGLAGQLQSGLGLGPGAVSHHPVVFCCCSWSFVAAWQVIAGPRLPVRFGQRAKTSRLIKRSLPDSTWSAQPGGCRLQALAAACLWQASMQVPGFFRAQLLCPLAARGS